MVAEIYDAFAAAGAPEDKARSAAQAFAEIDSRSAQIERRTGEDGNDIKREIITLGSELKHDIAAVKSEQTLMKWMLGAILTLAVAILVRLLF